MTRPTLPAGLDFWDAVGLQEAMIASQRSKDPSTGVGAYIADARHRMVSKGWNGFAQGIKDTEERLHVRELKYALTLHAEENALAFAESWRLPGATLYVWPMPPCAHCMSAIIQHGLSRVVSVQADDQRGQRWGSSLDLAQDIAQEAGVRYDLIERAVFDQFMEASGYGCNGMGSVVPGVGCLSQGDPGHSGPAHRE